MGLKTMESLIIEAKDIIEMSLNDQVEKESYALKAKDWLTKVEGLNTNEAHHSHDRITCASCGNDLVCPSCDP